MKKALGLINFQSILPTANQTRPVKTPPKNQEKSTVFSSILEETNKSTALQGDYNNDGIVDDIDKAIVLEDFGSKSELRADGNGDGRINQADLDLVLDFMGQGHKVVSATRGSLFSTIYHSGDYNSDGLVNGIDEAMVEVGFGSTTDLRADGNFDGVVDQADLDIVQRNWGFSSLENWTESFKRNGTPTVRNISELTNEELKAFSSGFGRSHQGIAAEQRLNSNPDMEYEDYKLLKSIARAEYLEQRNAEFNNKWVKLDLLVQPNAELDGNSSNDAVSETHDNAFTKLVQKVDDTAKDIENTIETFQKDPRTNGAVIFNNNQASNVVAYTEKDGILYEKKGNTEQIVSNLDESIQSSAFTVALEDSDRKLIKDYLASRLLIKDTSSTIEDHKFSNFISRVNGIAYRAMDMVSNLQRNPDRNGIIVLNDGKTGEWHTLVQRDGVLYEQKGNNEEQVVTDLSRSVQDYAFQQALAGTDQDFITSYLDESIESETGQATIQDFRDFVSNFTANFSIGNLSSSLLSEALYDQFTQTKTS